MLPLGNRLWQASQRVKRGFKGLVMPTMIWEELGFTYMGPFDGHDLEQLEKAFRQAQRHRDKPVFVHVITVKGRGYPPAETDAIRFHGVSGENNKGKEMPTYSEVFAQTLLQLMRENPRVVTITAAMSEGNCLSLVANEFPERVFDVGICEQHAVTFGAGMATVPVPHLLLIFSVISSTLGRPLSSASFSTQLFLFFVISLHFFSCSKMLPVSVQTYIL